MSRTFKQSNSDYPVNQSKSTWRHQMARQEIFNDRTDQVEVGSPKSTHNKGMKLYKQESKTSDYGLATPVDHKGKKRDRSRIRDNRKGEADDDLVRLSFLEKKIAERGRFRDLEKTIERVQTFKTPHKRRDTHKSRTIEKMSQRSNSTVVQMQDERALAEQRGEAIYKTKPAKILAPLISK